MLLERCKEEFSIDRVQQLEDIRALDISDEDKEEKVRRGRGRGG